MFCPLIYLHSQSGGQYPGILPGWNKSNFKLLPLYANTSWERYHDLPKRTGTDRNGLSGYQNGPKRTGTDRNGLSWIPKRTLLVPKRNLWVPKRTETDRNGPKRTFVDTETDSFSTEMDSLGTKTDRNGLSWIPKRTL